MYPEVFKEKLLKGEKLPSGIEVEGHLWLGNCTSLTHLPGGLEVGGHLDLEDCTSLTRLPEGLKVGGYLWLKNCTSLTLLPEGLKVGGKFYCDKSHVDLIPQEDLPLYINFFQNSNQFDYFFRRLTRENVS